VPFVFRLLSYGYGHISSVLRSSFSGDVVFLTLLLRRILVSVSLEAGGEKEKIDQTQQLLPTSPKRLVPQYVIQKTNPRGVLLVR